MIAETTLAYNRAWHRGNYGNGYESEDWESWYAENCVVPSEFRTPLVVSLAYRAGLLLGFFAGYEIHEIPNELIAEEVEYLRKEWDNE